MPPDLALLSTLIGSKNPSCLELIFMIRKVFEPLKFDCSGMSGPVYHRATFPHIFPPTEILLLETLIYSRVLTISHSERPKLYALLAFLSTIGLKFPL